MRRIALLLCAVMLACGVLAGCSSGNEGAAGSSGAATPKEPVSIGGENVAVPAEFSVRLFQSSFDGSENTMISPVSVLFALGMTANGAEGETLAQMEGVLGMPVAELNAYLRAYGDALPESEGSKLNIANSIWLTDDERFSVEQEFLQANEDFYGAGIYEVPFDAATLEDINAWVEDNTDGMIRDILSDIPPEAVMYLINAVAFDAEWREIYTESQIRDGVFTTEAGEARDVELMHSDEHLYLDDGRAAGFMKPYADSGYAFVALLPKEGVSVREYVEGLTGEGLASLLADPQEMTVHAALPKFESEYAVEMGGLLAALGMRDAFDEDAADFTGLGTWVDGNIYINRVLHKTFIAVDERGTEAGAATVVEMMRATGLVEEPAEVILDRPFVYMIVDCEAKLPLFIGTLMNVS